MVDSRYLERPGNVCIDGPQDAQQLGMLTALANAGRAKGSRIIAQLGHAGRQSHAWINLEPVGPGDVSLENPHGLPNLLAKGFFGKPRALSAPEVAEVVQRFGHAASVCQQCKFDGVQIHAAHGYLLSSFLNPRANNRDTLFGDADEYGGALDKRARALLDVVRAVRRSVGAPRADFLVSVKLNSADFQAGGFSAEEAVRVATWLEAEGIDLLEISGGNYESGIYFEGASSTPDGADGAPVKTPAPAAREAYFLCYEGASAHPRDGHWRLALARGDGRGAGVQHRGDDWPRTAALRRPRWQPQTAHKRDPRAPTLRADAADRVSSAGVALPAAACWLTADAHTWQRAVLVLHEPRRNRHARRA